jgi:ATP/maltotriose-dependent transcriptional regulator MalT
MANQFTLGSLADAAEAADRVVEHAVRAGDQRMAGRSAPAVAYLMVHGPTSVAEAIVRCEELFAGLRGDRKNEAIVLAALAQLEAMQGRFDDARATYRRARAILVELEETLEASATSIESSRVELLAGDLEAAERELRRDDEALAALDEAYFRSTVAAILANVLVERGDLEEARRYSELAERLADADDTWSQAAWRTARAGVLVRQGDLETAARLVDEAVALVRAGDDQALRAEILATGAPILAAAGRAGDARGWLDEARALYGAKGDSVSMAKVRERIEGLRGLPAG